MIADRRPHGVAHGRRLASNALIVAGSLLLVASATSVARGAIARDAARSRWAEMEAQRAVAVARVAINGSSRWATAPGTPVARLMIPRIGLDEVVVEGVSNSDLRAGPGHMIGSALPGDSGTSVISAHRDRHFHSLGGVAVGDTILTDSDRGLTKWAVARIRVVDSEAAVLRTSREPLLVLTTCWPIRYFGPAPDRLIIEARPSGNGEQRTGN